MSPILLEEQSPAILQFQTLLEVRFLGLTFLRLEELSSLRL
jgi:hypothetical protein